MTEHNLTNLLEELAIGGIKAKEEQIKSVAEAYMKVFTEAKESTLALLIFYLATMEVEIRDLKHRLQKLEETK